MNPLPQVDGADLDEQQRAGWRCACCRRPDPTLPIACLPDGRPVKVCDDCDDCEDDW